MKRFLLLIAFSQVLVAAIAQQATEKIKVTDLLKIKTVTSVDLSPDEKQVLFIVQSIIPDQQNKSDYSYDNQLWLAATTTGTSTPRQLTFSEGGVSQPVFSPDGQSIVFVRSVDRKPQLFLLSLAGGEAQQLTHHRYGASNPQWSKDGRRILFTASLSLAEVLQDSIINPKGGLPEWVDEKPGFEDNEHLKIDTDSKPNPDGTMAEIRAYLRQNEEDRKAKVLTKLGFQGETSTSADIRFSHIFVMDAKVGATPKAITSGFYSYGSPQIVDDNRLITSVRREGKLHPDRVQESQLVMLFIDGSTEKELLAKPGKSLSVGAVSPSGKWLAFQESETGSPKIPELYVMNLDASGTAVPIVFDRNKSGLKWSRDEQYLYFTSPSNGGTILCRATIGTGKIDNLTSVDEGIGDYDFEGGPVVYTKTSISNPSELFIADDLAMKNSRQLSDFNSQWIATKQLSIPEKHTFTNDEGMEVEYWVMKPINYQEGTKYPLLLEIHGGPSAMWGPGEASMWHEFQYFCAQGYGVVYSNPRGSGGYGEAFLRANMNNWGAGPTSDVLTSLDKAVAEGWADTAKLVITGGSYAGYLVSWIISHDHRFKAACSQRGVYDLNTFFGEGNAWRLVPNYFGGYPWEDGVKDVLERESPINYVSQIKTPYIIFHGENDLRTGVIQSEMLYKSLKVLGRPVEYVRHPGASHEITRSGDNRQRIDQMLRTYEFFERWID
ncbi:S9 family peptidase [Parapedobacter koreensis]|uniref:Dipeptidyl aminopeptidase/acylaminoacyl peptidase n=1 Tax=Parapedobacter koreensis TaxID=332977 RepID=A0A1H7M2U8_9SPHI|nr:S9 family peptidase [Parapedobacter koreensis]SEL05055.1 Dipeptidyl aminopeptidase/acylaminoacyl peptidase [Parapedobacter koreensis]